MSHAAEQLAAWAATHGQSLPPEVANGYAANARVELAPWRARGIEAGALERALAASPDLQRYQVLDGVLYRVPRRDPPGKEWLDRGRRDFEAMFLRLFRRPECPRPDLDLVVNLGDYPVRDFPVFSTWVRADDLNPRLPSSAHWDSGTHGADADGTAVRCHRIFEPEAVARPFEEREPRVVWRGSATGLWDHDVRRARVRAWLGRPWGSRVPRVTLVRLAEHHPDVLDAAFTGFAQLSARNASFVSARLRTEAWVPQSWFLRHRYVVNVDGNVATWSFLTLLGSGSVVLRQESTYLEFCGPQLRAHRPWIPVAPDLSDLVERARWCLSHPDETGVLAGEARAFSARWLSGHAVDHYVACLVSEYAHAFRGPVRGVSAAERIG